jgi:hypothetical protein
VAAWRIIPGELGTPSWCAHAQGLACLATGCKLIVGELQSSCWIVCHDQLARFELVWRCSRLEQLLVQGLYW